MLRRSKSDVNTFQVGLSREVPGRSRDETGQDLETLKYEWFLQELEMACVFAIKISIYIVCIEIEKKYADAA